MWVLSVVFIGTLAKWTQGELLFPPDFKFGAATAAYQVEGAWNVSDKGLSIWDTYTHEHKEDIHNGANGDVACDSYHLLETDLEMASNMSLDFYRFSLSWTRILPDGFPTRISEDGKNYYNKIIDSLIAKGIEPAVTIYHWDLPQRLQNLGGWTNPYIADWFADYADVVFSLFGDRVKTWITINEPLAFCDGAYTRALKLAPGIEDHDVAPYIAGKHILLAHAKAYRIYDEKYRKKFGGRVTIANHIIWYEGLTETDNEAAELVMELTVGRYCHPIFSKEGGWPSSIEKIIADNSEKEGFPSSRMPPFTPEEIELVKGTADFFSFNHYTSRTVRQKKPGEHPVAFPFAGVPELGLMLEGRPEWTPATSSWLLQYPEGMRKTLSWIKNKYGDLPILITENGFSSLGAEIEDDDRVNYFKNYLEQILLAIHEDKVNVMGYTAWSLMDNFEWMDGYKNRFGLNHVDFTSPERTRSPRKSARFYTDVIKTRSVNHDQTV